MWKALMLFVVAGMSVSLVAAGCGGDDDDDTTAATTATTGETGAAGGEPLSKQEFITEADRICAQGDKEINRAAGEVFQQGQQPSPEEQEQFISDTVLPNTQAQIDGIGALTPPEGDEEGVSAILDAAQEAIDRGEEDPSALVQEGGEDPFAEATRLAGQYGLEKCG